MNVAELPIGGSKLEGQGRGRLRTVCFLGLRQG